MSSTVYRTRSVPFERDFYFFLRPLVLPLREMLQLPPYPSRPAGSSLPVLLTGPRDPACASFSNADLRRRLTPFHEALVSFSFPNPFVFR
jgi:hypothetical protein